MFHLTPSQYPVITPPLFHQFTSLLFVSPLDLANHSAQRKMTKNSCKGWRGSKYNWTPWSPKVVGDTPLTVVAPMPLATLLDIFWFCISRPSSYICSECSVECWTESLSPAFEYKLIHTAFDLSSRIIFRAFLPAAALRLQFFFTVSGVTNGAGGAVAPGCSSLTKNISFTNEYKNWVSWSSTTAQKVADRNKLMQFSCQLVC